MLHLFSLSLFLQKKNFKKEKNWKKVWKKRLGKSTQQKKAVLRVASNERRLIKGNLIGSKANSQQAPVHWLREITKAKLSSAKTFFNHIFL